MKSLLIAFPGTAAISEKILQETTVEPGDFELRHFPDGESYVRIKSDVTGRQVVLLCSLNAPDRKVLPLYFLAAQLKRLGTKEVVLVAPYLAYMRQDKAFQKGEAVTNELFAQLISSFVDRLITIDPHLHRVQSLADIYSIPVTVLHTAPLIAQWITEKVKKPVLIGPDSESKQWVAEIAKLAKAPYTVLQKTRHSDTKVSISVPEIGKYKQHTPVLADDIISTAHTMIETVKHLKAGKAPGRAKMKPAVCVGIHPVFAGNAYEELLREEVLSVVSCNTIPHVSNEIPVDELIIEAIKQIVEP